MVDHSHVSLNGYDIIIASQNIENWRIRDNIINQARVGGVLIKANLQNGHVIAGNIISSNQKYGIITYGRGAVVTHHLFSTRMGIDIRIDSGAEETRITQNYFNVGNIENKSLTTQCTHNIEELDYEEEILLFPRMLFQLKMTYDVTLFKSGI